MKMAKASEADLRMALDLTTALESLERYRSMPSASQDSADDANEEPEPFDRDDPEDCKKALNTLLDIVARGSLFRVTFGMLVLLDPKNKVVDPNKDILELHPDHVKSTAEAKGDEDGIALRGGVHKTTTVVEGAPQ